MRFLWSVLVFLWLSVAAEARVVMVVTPLPYGGYVVSYVNVPPYGWPMQPYMYPQQNLYQQRNLYRPYPQRFPCPQTQFQGVRK